MKIVSVREMQSLDKKTIEDFGIPSAVLMERAAIGVTEFIEKNYHVLAGSADILIVAGTGNNGGDGFAIARLLSKKYKVNIIITGQDNKRSEENALQLLLVKKLNISCFEFSEEVFNTLAASSGVLIDALFGVGLTRALEGDYKKAVELINSFTGITIAVDIPSGINGDTGEVMGEAARATHTVTFAFPKTGLLMDQALDYTGSLTTVDIGIPDFLADEIKTELITIEQVQKLIPKRSKGSYKNQFGRLCLIGGSRSMSGAAVLAGKAALKSGAGLLNILVPESIHTIVAPQLPTAMVIPLKEKNGFITKDEKAVREAIEKADTVLFGPGIGREPEILELLEMIIAEFTKTIIIDADALSLLAEKPALLKRCTGSVILTPHAGELARLLKTDNKAIQKNRMEAVKKFTSDYEAVLVFKGAKTIIARKDKETFINSSGNDSLARGGTGDILAGIIGGLAAQKISPIAASLAGVYLHGLMADSAVEELSEQAIITEEFINYLSGAFKKVIESC